RRAPRGAGRGTARTRAEPLRGSGDAIGTGRDVAPVVAPPCAQSGPATRERLSGRGRGNTGRVTYPRDDRPNAGAPARPTANQKDKYARAREVLDGWLARGVWRREDRPAIYPYIQTYRVGGQSVTRQGFVALGEASDYTRGVV